MAKADKSGKRKGGGKGKGSNKKDGPARKKDKSAKGKDKVGAVAGSPLSDTQQSASELATVGFWFDPQCPWAWLTSRWMLEVEKVRPVRTVFHVMSLAILEEGRDIDEDRRRSLDRSWGPVRVAVAVERDYGSEQLANFYTALGTRVHVHGEGMSPETTRAALSDVGLPDELMEMADIVDHDDAVHASHHAGMEPVGLEVGTPVIHVGGAGIFGPVISPMPTGEEAGRMFDGVKVLATYPGFFELKRTRTVGPIFDDGAA